MRKACLFIISCVLTIAVSADVQSNSEGFEEKINEIIKGSNNILDDFWYGDDGEDCGEPRFSISSIDLKKQTVYLDIYQGKDIHACFHHSPFKCEMKYSFEKGDLKLPEEVDMLDDCQMFYQ